MEWEGLSYTCSIVGMPLYQLLMMALTYFCRLLRSKLIMPDKQRDWT